MQETLIYHRDVTRARTFPSSSIYERLRADRSSFVQFFRQPVSVCGLKNRGNWWSIKCADTFSVQPAGVGPFVHLYAKSWTDWRWWNSLLQYCSVWRVELSRWGSFNRSEWYYRYYVQDITVWLSGKNSEKNSYSLWVKKKFIYFIYPSFAFLRKIRLFWLPFS